MTLKQPNSAVTTKVNVLLFEAFSNMVLACLLEPLRVVRDSTGSAVTWTILTHGDAVLRSSSGMTVSPDRPLADAGQCDLLIVLGGDRFRADAVDPTLKCSLRLCQKADRVIAADTGPWMLASAGYLTGRRATVHWQILNDFADTFPDVLADDGRSVRDGRWITCGSAANALEVILDEIAARHGPSARFEAAAMFLNEPSRTERADVPFDGALTHGHPVVRRVVTLMMAHLAEPLPLAHLAHKAGLSLRSMVRLFERELGLPPGRYYLNLRLIHARDMALQTDLPLEKIALHFGFARGASLTRAHRRVFGRGLRGKGLT